MLITQSCRLKPGLYRLSNNEGTTKAGDETIPTFTPAITIKGNGITVDLTGVTLQGSPTTAYPDERRGLGILIEGKGVTIKNAHVHGYRVALMARHADGLKVIDSDFSYNWKQHLKSTVEREDESDWMSYHHNEHDEWLRYGAALSLWDCNHFTVKGTTAVGGQCGLMLTRCNDGLVYNDNFSFLSGLGIGMYRSSNNRIVHNRIDWDVRGFSYGVYNRGQDSAGILVFEQCNRNLIAYNSVTHGGDGFFLWAGQTTMDTGKGGCNDNLVLSNNFSYAPTNGIEATFSRNLFVNNYVSDCWHAVWDGYSFDTLLYGNYLLKSEVGVATEHGQNNKTQGNIVSGNQTGIQLWANKETDPNWGYVKARKTHSDGAFIVGNRFTDNKTTLSQRNSTGTRFVSNFVTGTSNAVAGDVSKPFPEKTLGYFVNTFGKKSEIPAGADKNMNFVQEQSTGGQDIRVIVAGNDPWNPWNPDVPSELKSLPAKLKDGQNPFRPAPGTHAGKKYILVDEWGPYDFKRPLIWPREESRPGWQRFEILGPPGKWSLVNAGGIANISASSGQVPGFVEVQTLKNFTGQTEIKLQYFGAQSVDVRGIVTPAGQSVIFGYEHFFAPIAWNVKFFRWSKSVNPSEPHAVPADFPSVLALTPIKEIKTDRLSLAGAALVPGLPNDHYATLAEGSFRTIEGDYTIDLTTDDGAKVWLDDKPLIEDAWHYQGPTSYTRKVHLTNGPHRFRVEHFQIDGYAELKLELKHS